jgi:hypothetical protein
MKSLVSKEDQVMLETLKQAVAKALERKRRLGQYAVVWRNGRPTKIGNDVALAPTLWRGSKS